MALIALLLMGSLLIAFGRRGGSSPAHAEPPVPPTESFTFQTWTSAPTRTPVPSGTASITPTPTYSFYGTYTPPAVPPALPIPLPVEMIEVDNDSIINILVLGSDSADNYYRRTDVLILVSINTQAGTVAMWHIPRAVWVYIPNYTMDLLNTVYTRGASGEVPGGGLGLLQETFRYNFGIELDHYARVNFTGFMKLIEQLGGLEISVDCALRDWRLKEPELDPAVEDNWEMFTLGVGRYKLSPYMALWYVRSRYSTDDLDRGRRQMDVLRALWQQIQRMGLLTQVSELWPYLTAVVDTDMALDDMLALVPFATTLDLSQVARYGGTLGQHYVQVYTPGDGREVLVPDRTQLMPMLENFLTPATSNRLGRASYSVEIADASWYGEGYARVAAERLAWEGFAAQSLDTLAEVNRELTVIYDYTGQTKGNPLPDLQRVLRVDEAQVVRLPDPNRAVDFRVEIGMGYRACVYGYAEDELAPASPLTPEQAQIAACWMRFRAEVNVRVGPGTAYDVLRVANPSHHFPITGQTLDGSWWQINADGESGWVSGEITSVDTLGDCSGVAVVRE
ncbi:MAG: LCP family protein [Chloroflexi bacterium]|nr:LCP family protein [Chloroflexota bacterium]